jgi:hypothetical protein
MCETKKDEIEKNLQDGVAAIQQLSENTKTLVAHVKEKKPWYLRLNIRDVTLIIGAIVFLLYRKL